MIQHALEAFVLVAVFRIKHIRHHSRFGNNLEQHHACFLIERSRAEGTPKSSQGIGDQFLRVGRSNRQRDQFGEVVLLYIRSEGRCVRIDIQLLRDGLLHAQLTGTMRAEIGDLFFQKCLIGDGGGERTRGGYALLHG